MVASNRGPLSFELNGDGQPVAAGSGGGLAGTLRPLLAGSGATWVAASMNEADRIASAQGLMAADGIRIVTLAPEASVYRMAYDVVSNGVLWFCHHHLFDLPRRPRFDHTFRDAWDAYRTFNRSFADAVASEADEGSVVLVQDYHLSLTGAMLKKSRPDLRTVHFLHTPFADPNMVRTLPSWSAGELLGGLAGFGSCGFHTARWESAFRAAFADEELSAFAEGAEPHASFASALGPDPEALAAEADSPACQTARRELESSVGDRKLIVRVDRVELSKNLLRGFWAFDELLRELPEWRERVVFLALAYPSREGLADYLAYRSEMEHTVERINDAWGTPDWTPIILDVADDRSRSVAALQRYDVLLVNPIRDGLNLVAKEGPLLNTTAGALVLSREAGAWEELSDGALGINPFDVAGTAAALDDALSINSEERAARARHLREKVLTRPAARWLEDQIDAAQRLGKPSSARRGGRRI